MGLATAPTWRTVRSDLTSGNAEWWHSMPDSSHSAGKIPVKQQVLSHPLIPRMEKLLCIHSRASGNPSQWEKLLDLYIYFSFIKQLHKPLPHSVPSRANRLGEGKTLGKQDSGCSCSASSWERAQPSPGCTRGIESQKPRAGQCT